MCFFLRGLCRQSSQQGAFVQLFPHVKQTYTAEYQITDLNSDTPADQLDLSQ